MDFELTEEQREIQLVARDFADAEIEPHAAEWDREHRFPPSSSAKLAELGLMGVCVPEEYGGAGADFLSYVLVLEEISRADAGVGVTVAVHTSAVTLPILAFGTDEQRARFVPPLARGEGIGAFALTEPEAGSDAGSLRTTAEADGDGWRSPARSSGSRTARTPRRSCSSPAPNPSTPGAKGVSAFVLDADHVRVTREEEKLGLNRRSTNDLVSRAPRSAATGCCTRRARASRSRWRRSTAGASGSRRRRSGSRRPPTTSRARTRSERKTFGKPIAEHQAIQWKLADMATEIDAARLLVYRAAWLKDQGRPHTEEGAMAKLFASEMARRADREAIQIFGGYGYTKEFPVERYYRDAKITEIYEGTSEIQRLVIASSVLGLKKRDAGAGFAVARHSRLLGSQRRLVTGLRVLVTLSFLPCTRPGETSGRRLSSCVPRAPTSPSA